MKTSDLETKDERALIRVCLFNYVFVNTMFGLMNMR